MSEDNVRRLPVYLLLDCSSSMNGDPIESVRQGIKYLLSELRGDPQALETVWLSVITFASTAQQVAPLAEVLNFTEPQLTPQGGTSLGAGLKLLMDCIDRDVKKSTPSQKGDWKPLVFLMTDGEPTDSWQGPADEAKKRKPGTIIACGVGASANTDTLKQVTDTVVMMNNYTQDTFKAFFKWVSASVVMSSQKSGAAGLAPSLAPLPKQIQMVP